MAADSVGNALTQRVVSSSGGGLTRPLISGTRHAVSAGHPLASQAAFRILEAGGNAVDAGAAAGMVLAVVQSDVVNFAGVAPMLVYSAKTGSVHEIAGLGYWPRAIPPDYFTKHHNGEVPHGLLRTVIPAAPDAWITALSEFGTMTFSEVSEEAIRIAREGFVMYPMMSNIISAFAAEYARWPSNTEIYLPNGHPPKPGDLFVQRDLAKTIQYMVDEEKAAGGTRIQGLQAARDAFYKGDIAKAILKYHRENGGLLTAADLEGYRTPIGDPVCAAFEGHKLYTPQPWCQGPALIEILRIAQELQLSAHPHNSVAYVHCLIEAIKAAFDDRHRYFGDPSHVQVPLSELLSTTHARKRADAIDTTRATAPKYAAGADSVALDTSYVCVVDRHGNSISATPSDVSMDTPVIPGTGICPSSRGSQSWADPTHVSGVAPGKRPRLTPSPALAIFDDGRVMPFGTPGGDVQLQAMAQVFLNITAFGMNPQEAVDAPRFATYDFPDSFEPHASLPGRLTAESDIGEETTSALKSMGHDAVPWPVHTWRAGAVCLIQHDPRRGVCLAAADPRRPSYAMAR
ncbi:gamma-glutamyltransferase family protein [Bordetella sp. BOR01]|uniref:gamma-glutamyltransferase family protein n=1 Tax=Bordetella sp. BOR01 TaxID=2854779 RepID=UPI001C470C17|nr:gamma-glutamyltransferase family protein [Bordetella sp. BOR01]MBV7482216.1 gamma-glutamyltransferase family protein [Bordetella sp. BOR01]